jgi:N-acetylmuramoyl-L-alanine amidase
MDRHDRLSGRLRAWLTVVMTMLLTACTTVPDQFHGTALPRELVRSPNFEARRPNFVILHHTGSDMAERALATLTSRERAVSAHYLIGRDGRLVQLVDERMRAWHAGESFWAGITDMNSASIGIELDNNGEEPFAEEQMTTLLALLSDLRERYKIPAANVLGHADVAPGRKTDPSHFFPWKRLAGQGFGLWCEAPDGAAPPYVSTAFLLQAIGYEVSDLPAAVLAFRRHFLGNPDTVTSSTELNQDERSLAYCLAQQRGR